MQFKTSGEAFKDADTDKDGEMSVEELTVYITTNLQKLRKRHAKFFFQQGNAWFPLLLLFLVV